MTRKHMMRRGGMMGGMMPGRMGSSKSCPVCGGPNFQEKDRPSLLKEDGRKALKVYLKELEAEVKSVKELVEEK